MNIIIVDDEAPARNILKEHISKFSDINILAECSNGFEALVEIQSKKPDLLLLDIQMPKINGFELLEVLDEAPEIIFITAYSEFALKAFEANAIDYLLKPISEDRLKEALSKARNKLSTGIKSDYSSLNELKEDSNSLNRIIIKTGNNIKILNTENIFRIEADDDYVRIHDSTGSYLKKQTMKYYESNLPKDFVRVHRSHILNIQALEKIEAFSKDSYIAILKNKEKIPVSISGYRELKMNLDF